MNYRTIFCIGCIVLLAVGLRLFRLPQLSTFRGDQAIELTSTRDITRGKFTLIGIKTSNSEVRNGAVMYYAMAPFLYVFSEDPLAGAAVQIGLQIAGIIGVILIGRSFFSLRTGMLAGFFLSLNALLILFSRQTLLAYYPFVFSVVTLGLLLQLSRRYTRRAVFFLGIVLGISLQVHYSTLSLLIPAALFPFLFVRKKTVEFALILGGGFFLGFSPMLAFEVRHEFFNTRMFFRLLTHSGASGLQFNLPEYWMNAGSMTYLGTAHWTGWLLTLFFLAVAVWHYRRVSRSGMICVLMILSWLAFSIVFIREPVWHYVLPIYPAIFLLTSHALVRISGQWNRLIFSLFLCLIGVIYTAIQLPAMGLFDNHGYTMHAGWTLPAVKKSAGIIRDDVGKHPFNVIMLVDSENQALPLRYFLEGWGVIPLDVASYDKATLLYVVAPKDMDIRQVNPYELSAFGAYTIESQWDISSTIVLYRLRTIRQMRSGM